MDFTNGLPLGFAPMLSAKTDDNKLKEFFEKGGKGYGSVKLDGIRCVIAGGKAYSRKGILIPNLHVQALAREIPNGLDGELIVGDPNDPDVYRKTESGVMTIKGEPEFRFYVFDDVSVAELPFEERIKSAEQKTKGKNVMVFLPQHAISTYDELTELEAKALEEGYEGAMFRKRDGGYKFGRSTAREMHLMKLKRDADMELIVTDILPAMHNANEAEKDAFGNTKRSSHQENLVPLNRAGKFLTVFNGMELAIAPGKFTHKELEEILTNKEKYIGKLLKFRYFPHGMKDLPRHPRALGWRNEIDT